MGDLYLCRMFFRYGGRTSSHYPRPRDSADQKIHEREREGEGHRGRKERSASSPDQETELKVDDDDENGGKKIEFKFAELWVRT